MRQNRNGRWRSEWTYKVADGTLTGLLRTTVHYYEDGNIQLNSDKTVTATIAPGADKKLVIDKLVKQIADADNEYQRSLNETYADLSETTFKGLRRALPVTKTKIDWDKILNYKLASALQQ
jgi:capping protein alpha